MKNTFRTKDLYLSAFLYAKNQNLARVDRENGVCWFIFEDEEYCDELVNEYWSGTAYCNIRAYSDALRTLKDRIFNTE